MNSLRHLTYTWYGLACQCAACGRQAEKRRVGKGKLRFMWYVTNISVFKFCYTGSRVGAGACAGCMEPSKHVAHLRSRNPCREQEYHQLG